MFQPIPTRDPTAVEVEVQKACLGLFPGGDRLFVPQAFGWAIDCFTGQYRDYQAIDALYHDFEHTLQGTLCLARLFQARHRAGAKPLITERVFHLGIIAILLHDTGYLRGHDDRDGTGAKYTVTHVARSAEFAAELLGDKGFPAADIAAVQHMIRCTGVNANVRAIPFADELERMAGLALATADLLGQMAADDYIDKLPELYAEFHEATVFTGDNTQFVASFKSADDLIRKTPLFWEKFVLPRLENEFAGLYRFLNDPFPAGPNWYVRRVEQNIERLRTRLAAG